MDPAAENRFSPQMDHSNFLRYTGTRNLKILKNVEEKDDGN